MYVQIEIFWMEDSFKGVFLFLLFYSETFQQIETCDQGRKLKLLQLPVQRLKFTLKSLILCVNNPQTDN